MINAAKYGQPKEWWLRGGETDEDPDRFGLAMVLCQDASGSCASTGSCTFGGDCFRSARGAAKEAAQMIRTLSSESQEVTGWLNSAAEFIDGIANKMGEA